MITHVETTESTTTDVEATTEVHTGLKDRELLPAVHLVDTGYTSADLLVDSPHEFGVELLGPVGMPTTRQARDKGGFDLPSFTIDWDNQQVICPQGAKTTRWHPTVRGGINVIETAFSRRDCTPCPVRNRCTDSATYPRGMSFHTRETHEALMKARQEQFTPEWRERYKHRAGIEGTISQAVVRCGIRRYIGLRKRHLQHILTACAMNIIRIDAWQTSTPLGPTRISHFTRLHPTVDSM